MQLPPYSPELNPIEQIGTFIKKALGNQTFDTIKELEQKLEQKLEQNTSWLWQNPQKCASLIHHWMSLKANNTYQVLAL